MTRRIIRLGAALLTVGMATACSSAAQTGITPRPAPASSEGGGQQHPAQASPSRSDAEFERIFRARQDSARMRFTPADAEFITHMIPHHAQAIEISLLAPKNGASPQIQTLAARIINAQKDEIRIMQMWLKDRGQPVPEVHVMMDHPAGHMPNPADRTHADTTHADTTRADMAHADMAHADMAHADMAHMDMPGMLTPAQIRELEQAKGKAFDRLFLERMIDHHRGAVTMVKKLYETDGALNDEAVFKIASDVQVDQLTEIARMELMLQAMAR